MAASPQPGFGNNTILERGTGDDGYAICVQGDRGQTTFEQVPRLLKQQTADVLINDFGVPEIVPVEFGGTLGAETQE